MSFLANRVADEADAPHQPYERERVEQIIAFRAIAGVLVLLCLLAVMAPSKSTTYQLLVLIPAALWSATQGMAKLPNLPANGTVSRPHWFVLGSYAGAALVAAVLSFGTWHSTSDRNFNGFERGGGSYTLLLAVLLGLVAIGLPWSEIRRPMDTVLHVIALGCGVGFIGAAFSGTATRGLSPLRLGVAATGVLAVGVASIVLRRRAQDTLSRQAYTAAACSAGGALMAASSFMSWLGGFIVNYRPGTTIGGFDGRVTLFAGVGVVAMWITHFLYGRRSDGRFRNQVLATMVLGFIGLIAVINSGSGSSQPARALAAVACLAVLTSAVDARGGQPSDSRPNAKPSPAKRLAARAFAGSTAVVGTLLTSLAAGYFGILRVARVQGEVDWDDTVATIVFCAMGVVMLRGATGAARGSALAAQAVAIVPLALALVMVIPPDRIGTPALVIAVVFAGIAALGLSAPLWLDPADGRDLLPEVRIVLRSKWLIALGIAIVAYVSQRWIISELISSPQFGTSDSTSEDLADISRSWNRAVAARSGIAIGLIALLATRGRGLQRSIPFIGAGAVLYVISRVVVSDHFYSLEVRAQSEMLGRVQFAFFAIFIMCFAIGRGRFSVPAVALAAIAGHPAVWDTLVFLVIPRALPAPVLREAVLGLPTVAQFFALAIVFLANPISAEIEPAGDVPTESNVPLSWVNGGPGESNGTVTF